MLELARQIEDLGVEVHLVLLPNRFFPKCDIAKTKAHWKEKLHILPEYKGWNMPHRFRRLGLRALTALGLFAHAEGPDQSKECDVFFQDWWLVRIALLHWWYRFDFVVAEYVFASRALTCIKGNTRKIIDTHDVFHMRNVAITQSTGIETNWLNISEESEIAALARADTVIAIQDREAQVFERLTNSRVITVGHIITGFKPITNQTVDNATVLFVGSANALNAHAIKNFIRDVWPGVVAQLNNIKLRVVGKVCSMLNNDGYLHRNIELAGQVESIFEEYQSAHVVVNPVAFGTGLAIKSIEALAHGKALVSTTAGARGLETSTGSSTNDHIAIADSAEAMTREVLRLLTDPLARSKQEEAARSFVQDWNRVQVSNLKTALFG